MAVAGRVLFDAAGVGQAESVVLRQNTAIPALAKVFGDTDLDTLKAYAEVPGRTSGDTFVPIEL